MAISTRLTPAQGRKFAFTLGGALIIISSLSWWRGHEIVPYIFLIPGLLLLIAGLLVPKHLGPIEQAWMRLGHRLAVIMNPVFMYILYFCGITTFGIIMRICRKRPLTENHQASTSWVTRTSRRKSDLARQF